MNGYLRAIILVFVLGISVVTSKELNKKTDGFVAQDNFAANEKLDISRSHSFDSAIQHNEEQVAGYIEAKGNLAEEVNYSFYYPLGMSCLAGASTGVGALLIFFMGKNPSPSHLAFALALAAGVMLSVSIIDMWIPLVMQDGFFAPTAVAALGGFLFYLCERYLPSQEDTMLLPTAYTYSNSNRKRDGDRKFKDERSRNLRLALVMMLTLTAHNFPEGLAVSVSNMKEGSGLSSDSESAQGFIVTIAIAVHNIPEGLAIATPYYAATGSRWRSVLMACLSGLSEPLGAMVALTVLRPMFHSHPWLVDYVLVFVAGVMSAVSYLELIPEARQYKQPNYLVAGIATGSIVMLLTMMYV